MLTKPEIISSISDGNLNPKMLSKFFNDMKLKSFSYDYQIQKDLVDYHEATFDVKYSMSKFLDNSPFSDDGNRVIELSVSHQFVVPGEKEYYKRSSLFGKYITQEDITKNIRFFKTNPIMFVNGEIFTNWYVKAYRERITFFVKLHDLHEILTHTKPDALATEIATDVKIIFLPFASISTADNLEPNFFYGNNVETTIFSGKERFDYNTKFFGFWLNRTNGNHYMIPFIQYNDKDKYFTLPEPAPTNIRDYSLMVVGMNCIKEVADFNKYDEWIKFNSEKMPLPKANIVILLRKGFTDTYVPNDGSVTLTEYYPNIYHIDNPDDRSFRVIAMYDDRFHNEHLDYDNEAAPYMERIDLLDQYKLGTVPDILREFKPIPWNYSINDFLEKNPYTKINFNDQWDSFLYKMSTISDMLKKWYLLYEEYQRRTFGYLNGWYHDISKYTNMEEKLRDDTLPDMPETAQYYKFKEPHYVFTYVNNNDFGDANSFCFFIDGRYTVPTKILIYRGYQFVYFPKRLIKSNTVIEVERFDGISTSYQLRFNYTDTEGMHNSEGIIVPFSNIADIPTIANSLFLVKERTGDYIYNDEIEVSVIDPEVGEVKIDLRTSVYNITPQMSLRFIPKKMSVVNEPIRLYINNKTFQFSERESGIDFTRGRGEEINLNMKRYISGVNKSILPRLRIFTSDGRLMPKRTYVVFKHENFYDHPKFNIPMGVDRDENFIISYIGYDEQLIYHRDNIPGNGLICIEGRTSRPFSFAYHDIYLGGFRLVKKDIEIISPYTFVIKREAFEKYDTTEFIEIYEKKHPVDSFVKFDYNEASEYLMDRLLHSEETFLDLLVNSLSVYVPTGNTYSIDNMHDDWYDFFRYWLPYHFIDGDKRHDLEAYHHAFREGGRTLLNADDRVRYVKYINMIFYFNHDLAIESGSVPTPPVRELDPATLIPNEDIEVDEAIYSRYGYTDNNFNPIYDDPWVALPEPMAKTIGYTNPIHYRLRYVPSSAFPHHDETERYVYLWNGEGESTPEFPAITSKYYKMSEIYPEYHKHMYAVPDDIRGIQFTTTAYMFAGCVNLVSPPDIDMSNVTKSEHMFDGCKNLTWIPSGFNVSNVRDLTALFKDCEALNEKNYPGLDTSSAEIFDRMFYNNKCLTTAPQIDMSKMKSAREMFYGCSNLHGEYPYEIDCSNISTIDDLYHMFEGTGITSVRLINLDMSIYPTLTSKVLGNNVQAVYVDNKRAALISDSLYKMSDLYPEIYRTMTEIPMPLVMESQLHTIEEMFKDCFNLTNIEEFDISQVRNMRAAMENCRSLPKEFPWVIDLGEITDTAWLKDMFSGSSVTKLTFKNVSNYVRSKLGLEISDSIEFIKFTEDGKIYFFPNKAKELEMFQKN